MNGRTALLNEDAKGVYVICATPFTDDGDIDFPSVARLIDFYIGEGVHGITLLGVMGEAPKLSDSEQAEFVRFALNHLDGRIPALVGVSNPGIDNLAALARMSMEYGAAGVMIAGMPGLKTDEQVYGYFAKVLNKLGPDIPICLQDYPPTTTVYMSVPVINRLINDYPQIKMFKHEDCPGHRKLSQLRNAPETDSVRRVSILTGNGGLYVPQELARGADGIMTGFAFSGMLVEVYKLYVDGKAEAGEDLFDLYLPVLRHEQQIGFGLALRKETLRRRGVLATAKSRDPGPVMDEMDHHEMDDLFARLKVKLQAAGQNVPEGI
jgi:4-hydroxy-tetrahydrodipicolinate synthase